MSNQEVIRMSRRQQKERETLHVLSSRVDQVNLVHGESPVGFGQRSVRKKMFQKVKCTVQQDFSHRENAWKST